MKPLFLCLLFQLAFYAANGQTPSSCTPSSLLTSTYSDDIKELALRRMYEVRSADTASIEIPQIQQDSILQGMAAITNVDSLVQGDSVFRYYCIHNFGNRKSLEVVIDASGPLAAPWAVLNTVTGYAPLDNLMSGHNFRVTSFYTVSGFGIVSIATDHVVNVQAFADSLKLFTDIYDAYPWGRTGSGNYIMYQRDSVQTYGFTLAWGDCPSGCTSTKTWNYKVDNSCNVTLLSVIEDVVDRWPRLQNCNLHPLSTTAPSKAIAVKAYPNPVYDILTLEVSGYSGDCNYSIADLLGRTVAAGQVGSNAAINVGKLVSGIYLLKVTDSDGKIYCSKLLKQ